MRASVTVRVPGSTSNLGAGFDCVGVALDRQLTLTARQMPASGASVAIERRGTLGALTGPPEEDLLYTGFVKACAVAGRRPPPGLTFSAESEIPVARGLGSSAAATVAGAVAATLLLDLGLDKGALALLCTELEGHADNVALAVYGGVTLALHGPAGLTVTALAIHQSLAFVFAVPDFVVETKHARAVLPDTVPYPTAVAAAGRRAALV
jgi:homoserine kinase